MSLWSVMGDIVGCVTEGVTDIVNAAVGEEESQDEGPKDLFTAVNKVMAGTTELSKAMVGASLGLTQGVTLGVTGAIAAACTANSTEEALGNAADVLTRSVAGELMKGMTDLSKGSTEVVKGVRHGIGACTGK